MENMEFAESGKLSRRRSSALIGAAVHRNHMLSKAGLTERAFTLSFSSLVYPQIWEDPIVDLEALAMEPHHRLMTIASGGCNVLSYLSADPESIIAVDLNTAHIALNRLKIAAVRYLPDYESFRSFLGKANTAANKDLYMRWLRDRLDPESRGYWEGRDLGGRRRIDRFTRGFYRYGLLGRFISAGHLAARLYGRDPRRLMKATSLDQQRTIYNEELKPLFDKPLIRTILGQRLSLFGLGIPPAQYDALSEGRPMYQVVEERLARLACDYDLKDNYFAWQAFNRSYGDDDDAPLPPYLQKKNFGIIRGRANRIRLVNKSFTDQLWEIPAQYLDRYVLLDAQDWMTDEDLSQLWVEITRTARPGARVIFRTAGLETILPGRVPTSILERWTYDQQRSARFTERDRSAIYGGFHLYILKDGHA